jgi:hypothetical protein
VRNVAGKLTEKNTWSFKKNGNYKVSVNISKMIKAVHMHEKIDMKGQKGH